MNMQQVARVSGGGGGGLDERGRVRTDRGMKRENRERQTEGEGSRMVGRTLHKYAWDERQRRKGGSEVRVKGRDCIDRFSTVLV